MFWSNKVLDQNINRKLYKASVISKQIFDFEKLNQILFFDDKNTEHDEFSFVDQTKIISFAYSNNLSESYENNSVQIFISDKKSILDSLMLAEKARQRGGNAIILIKGKDLDVDYNLGKVSKMTEIKMLNIEDITIDEISDFCRKSVGNSSAKYQLRSKRFFVEALRVSRVFFSAKKKQKIAQIFDNLMSKNSFFGVSFSLLFYSTSIYLSIYIGDIFSGCIEKFGALISSLLIHDKSTLLTHSMAASIQAFFFILTYAPKLFVLFMFTSFIYQTKIVNRINLAIGFLLNMFGLSVSSVIPLITGYTCSITAYSMTGQIENKEEKFITMSIINFLICSGKSLAIIFFVHSFLTGKLAFLFILLIYLISFVTALASIKILNFFLKVKTSKIDKAKMASLLPKYEKFSVKKAVRQSLERLKAFRSKIFSIALISWIVWVLMHVSADSIKFGEHQRVSLSEVFQQEVSEDDLLLMQQNGILTSFSSSISKVFSPLGFDWRLTSAVIISFMAKEYSVSALSVLYSNNEIEDNGSRVNAQEVIRSSIPVDIAAGFIIFVSLWLPCMSAVALFWRQSEERFKVILFLLYSFSVSYFAAFICKQIILLTNKI